MAGGLPEGFHGIAVDCFVSSYKRKIKCDGVGDQHPINRVTMNIGQIRSKLPKIGRKI